MKIVEELTEVYGNDVIEVISATYSWNHSILVRFSNGVEKVVNFKSFLLKSGHPSIRKYLDEELFKGFEIVDGNLNWNDFDLIFPIEDLLEGRLY